MIAKMAFAVKYNIKVLTKKMKGLGANTVADDRGNKAIIKS